MDSTVGREAKRTDVEDWSWSRKGVFSWVVEEGSLDLEFSSSVWACGGEVRLVERELLLLLAAAEGAEVCGGVFEFGPEFEGSGVKLESLSLSETLLWVMWIVICSCMRAERAAALKDWSSLWYQLMFARERTIQCSWTRCTHPFFRTRSWSKGTMNEAPLAQATKTTVS